ncbi:hypothetical protein [Nocardioides marmotae]|uniref:hypothetical protein n=1 Tax=Nocardioides marmotae TaxID=2663857 RepID=UPI0012B5BDD2|nr:hypothetical protein [Nocardioides marmotae]MBC9734490.1 hypothetical protein [Nocardioides marmotae]MTB85590.1 hypothetical protein [Nocardioides marmotae]
MTLDYYEQQAFMMRNQPGLSIADADFINRWVERAKADDAHYVRQQAQQRRQRDKEKATEVNARIDALQDKFVSLRKQAERNEVPWPELAKTQRKLAHERMTLEKVLESLQSGEAAVTRMESDPTAYLSDFYQRFPTLKDRRPSLMLDLAEDQRKRGVQSLH